jgi:hypothetical protein
MAHYQVLYERIFVLKMKHCIITDITGFRIRIVITDTDFPPADHEPVEYYPINVLNPKQIE